jgi:hypothetical protein
MPVLRECQTAVVARNERWTDVAETEPYEAGWASEIIIFLRVLESEGALAGAAAAVQISPDGIHWIDEGARISFPAATGQVAFVRLAHFGQYVRLRAELGTGLACKVIVTINAKA